MTRETEPLNVGFIGLGIMGKPMAKHLVHAGLTVRVNDLNAHAVDELVEVGAIASTLEEIGAHCSTIFTILPNYAIVSQVLFGDHGVTSTIQKGSIVCDLSSVTPIQSRACAEALERSGVAFVDAPVSGGEPGAIDGTLALMCGGAPEDVDRLRPVLQPFSSSITHVGPVGSGSTTKLCNQIIVNLNIIAVSEALVLATKAGVDPRVVYEAIRGGLAGSAVLDAKALRICDRNFEPGGKISINHKDINNVLETARALNVPLPFTAQLFHVQEALKANGLFDADHGAYVRYFEALAHVIVGGEPDDAGTEHGKTNAANPAAKASAGDTKASAGDTKASATPEVALGVKPLAALDAYPTPDIAAERAELEQLSAQNPAKWVILDDDPTGTQTVHDIFVYTNAGQDTLREAFLADEKTFYVLTNSRSMTADETRALHENIMQNLEAVSEETGIPYYVVSRSDSTLRGHFPLETQVIADAWQTNGHVADGEILCPFFLEGGRYTMEGVHYVKEGDALIPAAETEFAQDPTFGYHHSFLPDYVEEKTEGAYPASGVLTISLSELRAKHVDAIAEKLQNVNGFQKVVVDAISYDDLTVFAVALYRALAAGKRFIFRSAASLVRVLAGISEQPLLTKEDMLTAPTTQGGLVIVGSYTQKTTAQMQPLLELPDTNAIEFHAERVNEGDQAFEAEIARCRHAVEDSLAAHAVTVCYTSRALLKQEGEDRETTLQRSAKISDGISRIVAELAEPPAFLIAKGGITSSDVATKGLGIQKARVLGQVQPGIPVWQTGAESHFPHRPYVIFPGNTGDQLTLLRTVETFLNTESK